MNFFKKKRNLFFLFISMSIILSTNLYFFSLKKIKVTILESKKEYLGSIYTKQIYVNKVKKTLSPYMGKSLLLLSFPDLLAKLEREKVLLNLSLYKQFPNTLEVQFSLNPEFVLYLNTDGKLLKMLSSGKLFKILKKKNYKEPILKGALPKNPKKKRQFLNFIFKLTKLKIFNKKISTIEYISGREVHLFLEKPYLKIKFNWDNRALKNKRIFDSRIKKIKKVLEYLKQHSYKAKTIDARFLNKIFVSYY